MNTTLRALLIAFTAVLLQGISIPKAQADNSAWMGNLPDNTFLS